MNKNPGLLCSRVCGTPAAPKRRQGNHEHNKLRFSFKSLSGWFPGLSVPDAGMLVRIAGALDTTVNDLLGEEEPEQGRDLAAELEALNRQLAEREERSRRRWRAFFAAVGILALWGAVMLAAGLIR